MMMVLEGAEKQQMDDNKVEEQSHARDWCNKLVREIFELAGYVLVAGVFAYVAFQTKSWPVIIVASILVITLYGHIFCKIFYTTYVTWRSEASLFKKILFAIFDGVIFLMLYWLTYFGYLDIVKAFSKGVGI